MRAFDRHFAARALARTVVLSDTEAARHAGVSRQVLAGWRARLETDAELRELHRAAVEAMGSQWRRRLEGVAAQAAADLERIQSRCADRVVDMFEHPERHGETRADGSVVLPTTRDLLHAASAVMSDLRLTLDRSAEALTHYAAVVGEAPSPGDARGRPAGLRAAN